MEIIIQPHAAAASRIAADLVARQVHAKPASVLGLATGSTPLPLYAELVRLAHAGQLDFSRVTTFNLDEYLGLAPDHPQSYHRFMEVNLFGRLPVRPRATHLPDGLAADVPACCRAYENAIRAAGGIDLQILGIGTDGHVGFNEPTSSLASRTRIKTLTAETLRDNARFFAAPADQPHHVITMGIGTIMDSRCCLLLACGDRKAEAVARAVEGPVTALVPASALQMHPCAKLFLDEAAASRLQKADYYRWVYDHKPAWQRFGE